MNLNIKDKILPFLLVLLLVCLSPIKSYAQQAWILGDSSSNTWVFPGTERFYPTYGILRYGDIVRVTSCENNDCNSLSSWVYLYPYGAVRRSNISFDFSRRTIEAINVSTADPIISFTWGKVNRSSVRSTNGERFSRGDEILLMRNRRITGNDSFVYYERPNGGQVREDYIDLFDHPSNLQGWQITNQIRNQIVSGNGFVFVIVDNTLSTNHNGKVFRRYERFPIRSFIRDSQGRPSEIVVNDGVLPISSVRVGTIHDRPQQVIRDQSRFVHVDLEQQILTAYDNSGAIVYATLVSTGRGRNQTDPGVFRVRRKISYTQMRGGGSHPYSVEGVPFVLYFNEAIALHGAFWHDQFGTKRSHGCVNLSLQDARWVYNFMPMTVPDGWRGIHPEGLVDAQIVNASNMLWVVVE